jgi:hypothetical protein
MTKKQGKSGTIDVKALLANMAWSPTGGGSPAGRDGAERSLGRTRS